MYTMEHLDGECKNQYLETSFVYSTDLYSGVSGMYCIYGLKLGNGSYNLVVNDARILTENYDFLQQTFAMSCKPELRKGKRYSFTTVQCTALGANLTEVYMSFIGEKSTTKIVIQEDENGVIRWDSWFYPEAKMLYKVSDATNETGDNSITTSNILLLIIVIVVIVIIVIVVIAIIMALSAKRNQSAKKLPTQPTTQK